MPAFSLEPQQLAWCAELRTLAADRLRPLAEKGEPGRVNHALLAELGRLGLLERLFTSGALDLCLMRESLAQACTEAETALALQGLGAHPVHAHGTPAQRERWLPAVSEGSAVAAFALSEPGAGSDAAALGLRAEGEPGGPVGTPGVRAEGEQVGRGTAAGPGVARWERARADSEAPGARAETQRSGSESAAPGSQAGRESVWQGAEGAQAGW